MSETKQTLSDEQLVALLEGIKPEGLSDDFREKLAKAKLRIAQHKADSEGLGRVLRDAHRSFLPVLRRQLEDALYDQYMTCTVRETARRALRNAVFDDAFPRVKGRLTRFSAPRMHSTQRRLRRVGSVHWRRSVGWIRRPALPGHMRAGCEIAPT